MLGLAINVTNLSKVGQLVIVRFACLFLGFFCCSAAWALVPPQKELVPVQPVPLPPAIEYKDVQKIIPLNMQPTDNSGVVSRQIMDRSISYFWEVTKIKNPALVRKTANLEKIGAKMEVANDEGIKHVFQVQMLAFQNTASVIYTGWLKANISFRAGDPALSLQISRQINPRTELIVYRLYDENNDALNQFGLRWAW